MRTTTTRRTLLASTALLLASACSSTTSGGSADGGSTTTVGASTTSVAITTTVPADTSTTVAPAPTAAPTPTTAAGGGSTCNGAAGIPAGATNLHPIQGDIDGDLHNDTVTAYSLGGVPHVHAKLATGGDSDAEVPIGFGDTVEISFHDFDHSGGAAVPPPVAVLAVGHTKAGTAQFTFLTLTMKYCIRPWHLDQTTMYVGQISAEGPFSGLVCEGAMGHIYTSVITATDDSAGGWVVTSQVLHHNFTLIQLDPPQTTDIPGLTEAEAQQQFGDIVGCERDPLFS